MLIFLCAAGGIQADAVDELPPPPPFVTDSDTSGATSKTVSPQPPPQPVTPSHTWSQVADGPQEQKCPIPGEVADIAARCANLIYNTVAMIKST